MTDKVGINEHNMAKVLRQRDWERLTKLKEENSRLSVQAKVDNMTKLSRREELPGFLERNLKPGEQAAMIFFDIDHFKEVNDENTHAIGDEVLGILGSRTNNVFSPQDNNINVRYGGEEFVTVLKGVDNYETAKRRAEDFRKHIQDNPFRVSNNGLIPITISIGVVLRNDSDSDDEWVNMADVAMYAAKHRGRNQVVSFRDVMDEDHNH